MIKNHQEAWNNLGKHIGKNKYFNSRKNKTEGEMNL